MSLLAKLIRWGLEFFGKADEDFDRAVEALCREQSELPPITRNELARALEDLAKRKPENKDELTQLQAELFALGERIEKSEVCDQVPHEVWHFLFDADIRFKEQDYAASQLQTLHDCILELKSVHGKHP